METPGTIDDLLQWPHLARRGLKFLSTIARAYVDHFTQEAIVIDHNDDVYSIHKMTETKIRLSGLKVCAVSRLMSSSAPVMDLVALTEDGVVYGMGRGLPEPEDAGPKRVDILGERKVTRISCGTDHTLALTEDGEVWGWGVDVHISTDQQPWRIPKCIDIAAGFGASVALTEDGDIYARGTLCYWETDVPMYKVSLDRPVVRVTMGLHHVLVLTDDGRVFAWGANEYGQVGNNHPGADSVTSPECIECKVGDKAVRLVDIVAMKNTSLAVSTDGAVFMWGEGDTDEDCYQPVPKPCYNEYNIPIRNMNVVLAMNGFGTQRTLVIRGNSFKNDVNLAFDNVSECDCKFSVEGRNIYALKSLLRARSPYFKTMLDGPWSDPTGEITITGHSYPVYKSLLRYLCTGSLVILDNADMLRLVMLAHETMNDHLVEICVEGLRFKLSVDNILDVHAVAKALQLNTLLGYCKQFTNTYMKDIVDKEVGERPEMMTDLLKFAATK